MATTIITARRSCRALLLLCTLMVATGHQHTFAFAFSFGLCGKEVPNRLKKYYPPTHPVDASQPLNEDEEKYARELLLKGCKGKTDWVKNVKFMYNEAISTAAAWKECIYIGQTFHLLNEKQKIAILQHELAHVRNKDHLTSFAVDAFLGLGRFTVGALAGHWTYKISRYSNLKKIPSFFLSLVAFITTKNALYPIHRYEPWLNCLWRRHCEYRADRAIIDNCPDASYIKEHIKYLQGELTPPNPDALQNPDRPGPINALTKLCEAFPKNKFAQNFLQILQDPYHPSAENRIERLENTLKKMESVSSQKKE